MKTGGKRAARVYGLIAFDLDGTLIDSGGVSKRTRAALIRAHKSGCVLVLATGRAQFMIPRGVHSLPFSYVITSNGTRTVDSATGEVLSLKPLAKDVVKAALDVIGGTRASLSAHMDGRMMLDKSWFRMMKSVKTVTPVKRMLLFALTIRTRRVDSVKQALEDETGIIEKLNCVFESSALKEVSLERLQRMGGVEAVATSGNEIEITAGGVSKGSALKMLCERLDIPRESVLAFGDSGNDLSMLSEAACFIATENAADEVKAAAHRITFSAKNNGVAVVLEELFGIGEYE